MRSVLASHDYSVASGDVFINYTSSKVFTGSLPNNNSSGFSNSSFTRTKKLTLSRAVNNAMIIAQRQIHHGFNHHLSVNRHRAFLYFVHP